MKRLLTAGLILVAISGAFSAFAQNNRSYNDDIYSDTKKEEKTTTDQNNQNRDQQVYSSDDTYVSDDNNNNSGYNNRQDQDNYSDNNSDDYYYATRINRFNYPFYNQPYYSAFYNPNWYDPFWVDPYWGYNPWSRPGNSGSFGMGPYWTSYWGWSSWYGCGNFGSYYGYPYYSMYGGYYSNYWNGYYAGLYSNYSNRNGYRSITYGPRYSLNGAHNNYAHRAGLSGFHRDAQVRNNSSSGQSPQSQYRMQGNRAERGYNSQQAASGGRQVRSSGWFGSRNQNAAEQRHYNAQPQVQRSYAQPHFEQRAQPSSGRSFGGSSGGGRSFGGGSGGRRR